MKPRDFLHFFKTRSGKLVLFAVVFGVGLFLFGVFRERSGSGDEDVHVTQLTTNATDKPQVVQSIERQMQLFRPPPPKTNAPPPLPLKTNEPPKVIVEKPKTELPPPQLPTISLFADASAGVPEPKTLGEIYAPFGRLIPCETVITVDSASIQTPIIGLITENIYHAGKLVIPAGTEVHGPAQTDRHRERIASGGSWTLVWQGGEELRLKAIALDRDQGQSAGYAKDLYVERDGSEAWQVRRNEFRQKIETHGSDRDTSDGTERREQQTLREQLAEDTGSPGAQRGTHCQFLVARLRASQLQIRYVNKVGN